MEILFFGKGGAMHLLLFFINSKLGRVVVFLYIFY